MKSVVYAWRVEYIDADGEVHDVDQSAILSHVWPAKPADNLPEGCEPVPCLIRWDEFSDDDPRADDVNPFDYAYPGDKTFCTGHRIPAVYKKQLKALIGQCSDRRPE